ncbi:putative polyketide synthase [Aureobasidium pullulans]|nr:putative polyketide synthase [Aureobasidium pullulans]
MPDDTPIAVIGLSYRAPGIGRTGIWDYLAQARSAWTDIPSDRFEKSAYYKPGADKSGVFRAEGAHFVPDDIYAFDAGFFNMRAEEAQNSDPQHRMMLECVLEAAEDAGKSLLDLAGQKIGVFIGSGQHEYSQRLGDDQFSAKTFSATGVAPCMAANRVSYFLDIDGPSITLDAACASSVYAAHQAVSALRNGECTSAFVGSAALSLGPGGWLALEKTGALSEHGRSFSYDSKASGFGRGEGAACLLIKRVEDAIRDGDPIHAIIRNSACNHGGRSDGITLPNVEAQKRLLRQVHQSVGLDPAETPVVEVTPAKRGIVYGFANLVSRATVLAQLLDVLSNCADSNSDPIEASAFTAVLAKDRGASNPLYIGSIKSNFGHLEGASGILGMVKAILMLENEIILPTAGFEKINPRIVDKEKIRVADVPVPWPTGEARRAIVTNFGFGGSNAAVILEQAPPNLVENGVNGHAASLETKKLLVFSARTAKSLQDYLASFGDYLSEAPDSPKLLKDLAYTLGQRRTHHPHRVAIVSDSIAGLQDQTSTSKAVRNKDPLIAFAFTGQGAQYAQMVSRLQNYPVFAAAIDKGESILESLGASWSLKEELAKSSSDSRINEAEISQPACTAIQLALVKLLKAWNIAPNTVAGHSSGEIAAAYTAGLLSFETAIALAFFRGQAAARLIEQQVQQQASKGAMLAVGAGLEQASHLIKRHAKGYATVAAINSPQSVTISGDESAIEDIHAAAEAEGLFSRKLKVSLAYHSQHMQGVADFYLDAITPFCRNPVTDSIEAGGASPIFVSSVTGTVHDATTIDASYWVQNLVQPVLFADAMKTVLTAPGHTGRAPNIIVEVGPHAALKGPIKQTAEAMSTKQAQAPSLNYIPSLVRGSEDVEAMLSLAGSLYTLGSSVDLGEVNRTHKHNASVVTDVPKYSWDKSTSYEIRPRATAEKLFPGEPYHPLIGRRVVSDGGKDRAYRQVFTLDEMPWIRDHNVAGAVIFPMTGYMSCAIEAARRTVSTPAAAFLVKDFHVVRSMEIKEEESVDMVTKIKPAATGTGSFSATAWSFEISTWTPANGWTIHAYGQVEPEIQDMSSETPTLKATLPLIDKTSTMIEHDIAYAYEHAGVRATRYGPTFQNTVGFWEGDNFTVLEHRLRDMGTDLHNAGRYGSHVTVDPPTLDGFLQGGGPLQKTEDGRKPAQMPNYISRFRISNKIPATPKGRFDIVTSLLHYDTKGGRMQINVAAFYRGDDDDGLPIPVAEWESVAFRSIGSAEEEIDPASSVPDHWAWDLLPKFDMLPLDELKKRLSVGILPSTELQRAHNLERAAAYYIDRALRETTNDDRTRLPYHLSRFVNWANRAVKKYGVTLDTEPTALLDDVRSKDAQGELLCIVGDELVRILRGELETLELMLIDNRLTRHYEADVTNGHLSKILGDLADNLSDLEPNLQILEIGAGTGGTTLPILEALTRGRDEAALLSYTFTDISSGFFENARVKLAKWSDRITYKKLDIGQDPLAQGFAPGEVDIVVAANVLHATSNMMTTMTNVRTLLKPRGKLFLLEANQHPTSVLPFSLLPGWWYAEDDYRDREEGPMLPVPVWDRLLKDAGFSGVEISISDRPGIEQMMGIMCSTRVGKDVDRSMIVSGAFMEDDEVEYAQSVADTISEKLGLPVDIRPIAEIDTTEDPYYIFLDSAKDSLVQNMSAEKFELLQSLLLHNSGLLWVMPEDTSPDAKSIKGILRTLRLETDPKNLLIIEGAPRTQEGLAGIAKLTQTLRDPEVTRTQDQDFVWHNGSIHFPRMRQLKEVKEQFAIERGIAFRKQLNLWEGERALEMTIDTAGSPDSIFFRRIDVLQQAVKTDEILIKVEAAGLSSRDLDLILGTIPWSTPGFDGVGKVVAVGSEVEGLQQGDSVAFLSAEGSAFSTYKKLPTSLACKVPSTLETNEAASLPMAYTIAVMALQFTARLRRGETVLVHAATGAVGQACIVLAQHFGARVFVTAGNETKREFLHKTFGIPHEQIFSSRNAQFRDSILCATNGKGIDVVVNSLSGELMTETWSLTAKCGRFIEIGKKNAFQSHLLSMKPFDSNVAFSSIDIRDLYTQRPEEVKDIFAEVSRLIRGNVAVPTKSVTVLPISDFSSGLRKIKSGESMGKIIFTFGTHDEVIAESDLQPTPVLMRTDATYLITGGTRGIGLDLAQLMIDLGARNIVLLGRSGGSSQEVQKLLQKYAHTDVHVEAFACDVGSPEQLQDIVDVIGKDLPPVRGVIHSALLLSDKLFELATYEDWQIITGPRVRGAWNLDHCFPEGLDFFINLSSFLGDTGNVGQAIYAGTAAFYDGFTQYRNARGQHTVSIALPVVLDVGYVAQNDLSESLKQTLGATLTMADIRTAVKGAIFGKSSPFHHDGKIAAFKMYLDGQAVQNGPWKYFHPVHTKERLIAEASKRKKAGVEGDTGLSTASWTAAEDPLTGLLEALISKVSAMTMIEREDVRGDVPLASYSLDSLVSVELRNWIRRETSVELALSAILQAENLQALAENILIQREAAK